MLLRTILKYIMYCIVPVFKLELPEIQCAVIEDHISV